ncbi:metallothionein-like protein type 2 [Artemisia annua]|uniref:Metallothionein-like protein n=1 Tax=Artemisia annua TaxID=35608 RepID=A0A2U1KG12_ARTAN|nr:metallothionein-like protein type 2 [Artemisia annua]
MSSTNCCGGSCGCGSACKCQTSCSGCKMSPDFTENTTTTTTTVTGLGPNKSHEGSEMGASTSENDDDGCKCGDKCTCDPCTCK